MNNADLPQPSENPGAELARNYELTQMTDSAMAEMFGDTLKNTLAWTSGRGWLLYRTDGGFWESVSDVSARDVLRREMDDYWKWLVVQPDFQLDNMKRLIVLADKRKIDRVFGLMAGVLELRDELFDRDPWLLCVGNGVISLRQAPSGTRPRLKPWLPTYYFTKHTSVDYVHDMHHPDWDKALDAIPSDKEALWFQSRIGQAATGRMTPDHSIIFCTGGGSNGKSTLLQSVRKALGTYAVVVPENVLTADPSSHPTELTTLLGARLALIEELPEGKFLPSKRIKDLAGTSRITARRLYKDFIEWDATHTLFVTSNYRPLVSETDEGTWRRLVQLTFPMRFIGAHKAITQQNEVHGDSALPERLLWGKEQQQAVLSWIVDGAVYCQNLFSELPDRVDAETTEWRNDSDVIRGFILERCELDPDGMVSSQELFQEFKWYMDARGHRGWTEATFAGRLSEHPTFKPEGVEKMRTRKTSAISRPGAYDPFPDGKQQQVWKGLRFRSVPATAVPVQGVQGLSKLFS